METSLKKQKALTWSEAGGGGGGKGLYVVENGWGLAPPPPPPQKKKTQRASLQAGILLFLSLQKTFKIFADIQEPKQWFNSVKTTLGLQSGAGMSLRFQIAG